MSGLIRRLIGPTKERLQGYIKQARNVVVLPIDVSNLEKEEQELEDLIRRLSTNIARLEKCNEEWLRLLDKMKGDEKLEEEKEYCWAADGNDGLIELLLDSNETVASLQGRLSQVLRKQERGTQIGIGRSQPLLNTERRDKVNPQIKLPKLNLPSFDGNILNWQEFWDIFKSTIHEQDLPNVTKVSYLKGVLRGAAATAVGGISVTNENYDTAIRLLTDKFGKREVIIDTLYSQLQFLPVATNQSSDVKSTFESIEKILRQLEAVKEDINNQKVLIQQVLSQFPTQVIVKLEESKPLDESWNLPLVRKSLERYITIFTNAQCYESNTRFVGASVRKVSPYKSVRDSSIETPRSTDTFVTNTSTGRYKSEHFNDSCDQHVDVFDRRKQLQSSSEDNHPPESEQKPSDTTSVVSNALLASGERVLLQTAQITGSILRGPLHQADIEFLKAITPDKMADNIPIQPSSATIDILLGSDYFWSKYPDQTEESSNEISSCLVMAQNEHPSLSDLWTLETIGIHDPIHVREDDKALEKFNNTICCREG
ncbi:uncharacterized protein [Dysidea avara]|uniref:uncharacterized protein n=1 Tax=Dysidea avara TaxID=196820 RepID=UPI00332CBA52